MAENGNRGPNDFRGRNGKRRREPPIIDASATELPTDAEASGAAQDLSEPRPPEAEPADDPVLFGTARRVAEPAAADASAAGSTGAAPASDTELAIVPSALDGEPAPGEPAPAPPVPEAAAASESTAATAAVEPATASAAPEPVAGEAFVPRAPEESVRPAVGVASPASPVVASSPSSGGGGLWLLGVSNLVLLGALAWVLYSGPGRDGVADLRRQVAALEARPDASKLGGDVASLDKRLGAADADRQALAKSVAGLTSRLDGVAQAAQTAKADADKASSAAGAAQSAAGAAQSDANRPAPTGAAALATVGALAALAGRIDGVDKAVSALSADQTRTAKAVADLPKPVPPDFGPVEARVAAVEAQLSGKVATLDGRLTALDGKLNGADARSNAFDAKVNAVEAKINGFDARANGIDARANASEGKLNDEAAGLAKLQTAVAGLPKVDLGPLQAATAALDKRVAAAEAELAAPKDGKRVTQARAVGSGDWSRATPIALVGQSVQRAIADGRPYASDLDTLKALGAEPDAVAKLQPTAANGAPSVVALRTQWDGVRGDVLAAVKPAAAGSALDRFADNARALVQVRQVGAVQGDDPGALVTQVDAALAAGDVRGALAAWTRLPPAGQDRSKEWAAAARARLAAAEAAQGLVSRAVAALGKTDD